MIRKTISLLSRWLSWFGSIALIAIMLIVVVMIFVRKLDIATMGFYELIMVLCFFLFLAAWPYTQEQRRHIRVTMLLDKFPQGLRAVDDSIMYLLSLGTCVLMVWASIIFGHREQVAEVIVNAALPFPLYPFFYVMAFSFFLCGIMISLDLLDLLKRRRRNK